MDFKTVFTTFSSAEANLLRGRLEVAGFDAVIHGELAGMSLEGYTSAAGGIRVQVPDDQAASARELIEAEINSPSDDSEEGKTEAT
jgi:hypothetical protein